MSLLDPEEALANNFEYEVRKFLDENYGFENILFDIPYSINIFEGVDGLLVVDVIKGHVYLNNLEAKRLTNGFFRFGKIDGNFHCDISPQLESLEGAPEKCKEFNCTGCYNLMRLEGAPQKCEEFKCICCNSLVTLEGAPQECQYFNCSHCMNLKSLKGAPQECEEFMCTNCNSLVSLENLRGISDKGKIIKINV